jgi:phage baseplate assembly protein W
MILPKLTPTSKKPILYSDFFKDFSINPISSDIAIKTNEDSVKESIKNLVLTDRGERLFQPTLGGNVRKTLFDNMTPASIKLLEEQVKEVINNYEPRAALISVEVIGLADENKVQINVSFYVRNNERPLSISIFLERTR